MEVLKIKFLDGNSEEEPKTEEGETEAGRAENNEQVEAPDDAERERVRRQELVRVAGKAAILGPGTRILWTRAVSGEGEKNSPENEKTQKVTSGTLEKAAVSG